MACSSAKRFMATVAVAMAAVFSVAAEGLTYYWAADPGTYADFGNLNNWKLDEALTVPAERLPTAEDNLWMVGKNVSGMTYIGCMDLGGESWAMTSYKTTIPYTGKCHWLCFRNGEFTASNFCALVTFTSNNANDALCFKVERDATLNFYSSGFVGSKYVAIGAPAYMAEWMVEDGGVMKVMNPCEFLKFQATVQPGGRLVMADGTFAINNNAHQNHQTRQIINNGILEFPNGWEWVENSVFSDYSNSADYTKNFHVIQQSGTVRFGGDFKKTSLARDDWKRGFFFEFNGGKLIAEENSSVSFVKCLGFKNPTEDEVFASVAENAAVEVETLPGSTLDMTLFTYGEGAEVTKSGAGLVKLLNLPSALTVNAGAVEFDVMVSDALLETVDLADGVTVVFGAINNSINALDNVEALNFSLAANVFEPGDVIFTSTDLDILQAVFDRMTNLPAGLGVKLDDAQMQLSVVRRLTLTPRTSSVRVGDEPSGSGFTVTGLAAGDKFEDVVMGEAYYDFGEYDYSESAAGEYALTMGGFYSDAYQIDYAPGKLVAVAADAGEVFYWGADRDTYAPYGDMANWYMDSALTIPAVRPPCAADQLWAYGLPAGGDLGAKYAHVELDGCTYAIGGYVKGDSEVTNWKGYNFYLRNGAVKVLSPYRPDSHSSMLYRLDGVTLDYYLDPSYVEKTAKWLGSSSLREMLILEGESVATIHGYLTVYGFESEVAAGSTLIFEQGEFSLSNNSNWGTGGNSRTCFQIVNSGEYQLPNGLNWTNGPWNDSSAIVQPRRALYVQNAGGELLLGGNVRKEKVSQRKGMIAFTFNGGKLTVPEGASAAFVNPNYNALQESGEIFGEETTATVAAGATLEISPLDEATLQLTNFIFGAGATLVKTGAGKAVFAEPKPQTVTANEGTVSFATAQSDLAAFDFADGVKVEFAAAGNALTSIDNAANLSFTCDCTKLGVGDTIVESTNAELLDLIAANFVFDGAFANSRTVAVEAGKLVLKKLYRGTVLLIQ